MIIPCLLDNTPLPDSLKAAHGIDAREPAKAIPDILAALQTEASTLDPAHRGAVIHKLSGIASTDPQEVVRAARAIFEQHRWTAQGNVYQAAGDINISTAKPPKTWLDTWQAWVAIVGGTFAAVLAATQIKDRVWPPVTPAPESSVRVQPEDPNRLTDQPLGGTVFGEQDKRLSGVEVRLPDYGLKSITNDDGKYQFKVKATKDKKIDLVAEKDGYSKEERFATLGNTHNDFTMQRTRR